MQSYYSDNPFKEHDHPALKKGIQIAFVGNSLTLHDASSEIGWNNQHGMAASQQDSDYVHLILKRFQLTEEHAYIRNFYPFESDLSVAPSHLFSLNAMLSQQPPLIVIQLGDNVGNQEQLNNFAHNLKLLVERVSQPWSKVFCISTWWESAPKDYVIAKICELYGATYVSIGDLFNHSENTDKLVQNYPHLGVEAHPKDWGMAKISERLWQAIQGDVSKQIGK